MKSSTNASHTRYFQITCPLSPGLLQRHASATLRTLSRTVHRQELRPRMVQATNQLLVPLVMDIHQRHKSSAPVITGIKTFRRFATQMATFWWHWTPPVVKSNSLSTSDSTIVKSNSPLLVHCTNRPIQVSLSLISSIVNHSHFYSRLHQLSNPDSYHSLNHSTNPDSYHSVVDSTNPSNPAAFY